MNAHLFLGEEEIPPHKIRRLRLKKIILSLTLALLTVSVIAVGGAGAAAPVIPGNTGPFNGKFQGTVHGDQGSQAPLTLNMSQNDEQIRGTATLGQGLYVDGGWCGKAYIPATSQSGTFKTLSYDPNRVLFNTTFDIRGLRIGVNLNGKISPDGKNLTADARIDLPWFCGKDPVINGFLYKAK